MREIIAGQGKHQVKLQMLDTGNGWCGLISGGLAPHVGGVVLAVPRLSLSGQGPSCDAWVIPVAGHKDTEVALPLAKELCLHLGVVVSLSAGIHLEQATVGDIRLIQENCREAGRNFLLLYEKD